MKHRLLTAVLACVLASCALLVQAATPEEKGLSIAKEQQKRDEGWGDSQSEMKMVLRSASGSENVRMIKIKSLEVTTDGDKSLMVFDEPKDVQGTSFLSFSHVNGPDDQWIYLPALKRVKRIASNKKSGSFMGSEFSYEDLSSFEPEKYSFKYLRDETLNGERVLCDRELPERCQQRLLQTHHLG
jgi:hypothetical protein